MADLYRENILDHYRNPRNARALPDVPEENLHENPTCGDAVKLAVELTADGRVERVAFEGHGCAMSVASASMMTELLSGRTLDQADAVVDTFIKIMQGKDDPHKLDEMNDLACFSGVIQYPVRVKCVTLAWHAVKDALERARRGQPEPA